MPFTLELGDGVLAFHGSLRDDLTYLLETVEPAGVRRATEQEGLDGWAPPPTGRCCCAGTPTRSG